jgi:hypothetical protein
VKVTFADQWNIPCVIPQPGETADDVMQRCQEAGAIYTGEGEEDFCVMLRPDVGPEIYSESALRRSLKGGEK